MGTMQSTINEDLTNTRLTRTGINQEKAVTYDFDNFYDKYVRPAFVTHYDIYDVQIKNYDNQYGQFIENKLNKYCGFYKNAFERKRDQTSFEKNAQTAFDLVINARQGMVVQDTMVELTSDIVALNETILMLNEQLSGSTSKRFQAPLIAEVESTVSLDIRYWYYIKEYGPPDNGVFDPVKLARFVYTDASGNPLIDQESIQYDGNNPDFNINTTDDPLIDSRIDFGSVFVNSNNDFWQ
jgi:hypothetical protein